MAAFTGFGGRLPPDWVAGLLRNTQAVERERHGRRKNLVVAATGTGKTIVAALDYRRLRDEQSARGGLSLLFVAHRQEILRQSLSAFRQVLRTGDFGEPYVDGHRPDDWRYVFASVQSLAQLDLAQLDPKAFDMVIVDEFHHAAAPTYRRLLEHLQPEILLGLTATPERTDAGDILHYFDGHIAVELRLWDALERGLLCPFQYFGLHDNTDLSAVTWSRKGYDASELANLYTADDARVRLVLQQVHQKHRDARSMRALGFCVSIAHAEFMARRFTEASLPALAVSAETESESRKEALADLRAGRVRALFAVDLFNEGVDLPEVDTILFLRPTESALVFLQQLGRGLRRYREKDKVTVLDCSISWGQSAPELPLRSALPRGDGGHPDRGGAADPARLPVPPGRLLDAARPGGDGDRPREPEDRDPLAAAGHGAGVEGAGRGAVETRRSSRSTDHPGGVPGGERPRSVSRGWRRGGSGAGMIDLGTPGVVTGKMAGFGGVAKVVDRFNRNLSPRGFQRADPSGAARLETGRF